MKRPGNNRLAAFDAGAAARNSRFPPRGALVGAACAMRASPWKALAPQFIIYRTW